MTHRDRRFGIAAAAAALVIILTSPAEAQLAPPVAGNFYIGGEGGWTQLNASTITGNGAVARETFSDGYNVGARAGYQWGPWRFEGEFAYRRNDVQGLTRISPTHLTPKSVTGDRHSYSEMANLIYDFDLGWPVTPHIGGGVGAAEIRQNLNPSNGSGTFSSDTVFAYQGLAGLRYLITPAVALDLDYRYFATVSPKFRTVGLVTVKADHETHNLVASLTLLFGAAPPPAAAPLTPAPPIVARKVFLVFFDWDRDTITPEGMQIVQQAAAAFSAGAPVTIQVTGYADRSGSPGYNQRLSERRANNVSNALVRLGVPRQAQVVGGRGENDNRVPTADGVREPQNRRVEIVFP